MSRLSAAAAAAPIQRAALIAAVQDAFRAADRPIAAGALAASLPAAERLAVAEIPSALSFLPCDPDLAPPERAIAPFISLHASGAARCVLRFDPVAQQADVQAMGVVRAVAADAFQRAFVDDACVATLRLNLSPTARPDLHAAPGDAPNADRADRRSLWAAAGLPRLKAAYAQIAFGALLVNLFGLATPLFSQAVYDRVIPYAGLESLTALAVGVVIALTFDFLIKVERTRLTDSAAQSFDLTLSQNLYSRLIGAPLAAYAGRAAGEIAADFRDVDTLRDAMGSLVVTAVIDFPFLILFLALIGWLAGPLLWIPLLAVTLLTAAGAAAHLLQRNVGKDLGQLGGMRHSLLVESARQLEQIKLLRREGQFRRRWADLSAGMAALSRRHRLIGSLQSAAAQETQNLVVVGVLSFGALKVIQGDLSVGALIAASLLSSRAMASAVTVASVAPRLANAALGWRAAKQIWETPTERTLFSPVGRAAPRGGVGFRTVTFAYPGADQPALRGVSFDIRPGERVAIVGGNGSGKSTVGRLIAALHHPNDGVVTFDDAPLTALDLDDVRAAVAVVPQTPILFRGALRDNLAPPSVGDAEILETLRRLGADGFALGQLGGLGAQMREDGAGLSIGQLQLLTIARALLDPAPILLLDEPTAALDAQAEERVVNALAAAARGRTLIAITHRPRLLTIVDRLIVLENGRVAQDGPRDEVALKLSLRRAPAAPASASASASSATAASAPAAAAPPAPPTPPQGTAAP